MGKWLQAKCENREPLAKSNWYDEPYRGEHKNKQRWEIIETWYKTTYEMYKCGHRNGIAIELSLSNLFFI